MLVGLRHAVPQHVLPLHNLIPLSLGFITAARAQPMCQQLPDSLPLEGVTQNALSSCHDDDDDSVSVLNETLRN